MDLSGFMEHPFLTCNQGMFRCLFSLDWGTGDIGLFLWNTGGIVNGFDPMTKNELSLVPLGSVDNLGGDVEGDDSLFPQQGLVSSTLGAEPAFV